MGSNGNLGAIYAGRFIAGLGVGQTVVVAPVYLAEIAPAPIRGLCTCVFTGKQSTAVIALIPNEHIRRLRLYRHRPSLLCKLWLPAASWRDQSSMGASF